MSTENRPQGVRGTAGSPAFQFLEIAMGEPAALQAYDQASADASEPARDLVVFGASGDLSRRKGRLILSGGHRLRVIGAARSHRTLFEVFQKCVA